MELKDKVKIFMMELSSVYCDSCVNDGIDSRCEECHRKMQNWGLSESKAIEILNKIND